MAVFLALVLFLVSTFALPCIPASAASTPECWAVIAGVSNYQYINDLNYSDDDARELSDTLSPVWGTSHIRLLTDSQATKTAILSAISWLASNADADDTVLFSFSGHGFSLGYFCPYDTSVSNYATMISSSELANSLRSVQANKSIVVLDICYAGIFQSNLTYNGRVTMMACRSYEQSTESGSLRNGVFTYYILQALGKFDTVDTNHDYELSAEEVAAYAYTNTYQYDYSQHPVTDDRYSGELALLAKFVFATNIYLTYDTSFTLDGKTYLGAVPSPLIWVPGVSHTITVPQLVDEGTGTRYVFTQWNDGSVTVTRVITKGSYTVNYDKEHFLKVISALGETKGDGWYKDGSKASFSVTDYIELPDTKHYFTGWTGDYSGTGSLATLYMDAPKTVTAGWRHEYLLTLNSKYGTLTGAGWYREGATASISVTPYIELPDTKHYFTGWSGSYTGTSSSASIIISNPKVVNANWRHEYLLTLNSEYGEPTGAGWYKEGESAPVSVEPIQGVIIRQIFTGWSGDLTDIEAASSVAMNSPKVITATWRTDYIQLYILIGGVVVLTVAIITTIVLVRRHRRVV